MNLEQAITTALEYEGRVHRTYSEAIESAEHDVARRVFSTLCDEEMEHIKYLRQRLEEAGSNMEKVVKVTVFLIDMTEFKTMNGVYAGFFPDSPPARSAVQVGALPLGARVEIEAVAQTSRPLA